MPTQGITYELAKRLRDAGFPGSERWGENGGKMMVDIFDVPTLEELIEACGERYTLLKRERDGHWRATGAIRASQKRERFREVHLYGSTPEEAIAMLWLALNKK